MQHQDAAKENKSIASAMARTCSLMNASPCHRQQGSKFDWAALCGHCKTVSIPHNMQLFMKTSLTAALLANQSWQPIAPQCADAVLESHSICVMQLGIQGSQLGKICLTSSVLTSL